MEEIKDAVWSCGSDRASGPDGFTFWFIKRFLELIKKYVCSFVDEFYSSSVIPFGCNSSFFTLIPKKDGPIFIKDYRPISLIGVQYKIITKLLANRLRVVIDCIISPEQFAFVKGRQILDGPFLVNEIIDWYKKKKRKS